MPARGAVLLLLLLGCAVASAAFRSLRSPLTTAAPTFRPTTTPPLATPGAALRGWAGAPLPTNSWASVIGVGDGGGAFSPQP